MITKISGRLFLKNYHKLFLLILISIFFFSCVSPQTRIISLFNKAKTLKAGGRIKESIAYFKTIIEEADKEEISPFLKKYYKALSYLEIGEDEKALNEIEKISPPAVGFREEFLLLKSIYFLKKGFYEISKELSENLLKTKKNNLKFSAAEIYSQSLIFLLRGEELTEKEYLSGIKSIEKLTNKDFSSPLLHYYLFSLYLNSKEREKALTEAILSLEFGIGEIYKRDILYSIKFILKGMDKKLAEKYEKILRRYYGTGNRVER